MANKNLNHLYIGKYEKLNELTWHFHNPSFLLRTVMYEKSSCSREPLLGEVEMVRQVNMVDLLTQDHHMF